jgi:hypothetical protein
MVPANFDAAAYWSRGYLIQMNDNDGTVIVHSALSDQSAVKCQVKVWPQGTSRVRLSHAAAAPSGETFAVSGTAFASNGALSGFIDFFGLSGTQLFVQLPNTGPMRIVFADDGTLWVIARQVDTAFQELGEYNTLLHYNVAGKFLGSAQPRSGFPGTKSPMFVPSLTSSHDALGIYYDRAGIWVELSYDGSVKGRWQVPPIQLEDGQTLVRSQVYLTDTNQLVRVSSLNGKQPKHHATHIERLNKSDGVLVRTPIDLAGLPSQPYVLGVDSSYVVWFEDATRLQWSKLQ